MMYSAIQAASSNAALVAAGDRSNACGCVRASIVVPALRPNGTLRCGKTTIGVRRLAGKSMED
jgi:hypothetical protein